MAYSLPVPVGLFRPGNALEPPGSVIDVGREVIMAISGDTTTQFPTAARLIRCRNTKRYYNESGWSDDPAQAYVFPNETEAARACVVHDLHDVELVLRSTLTGGEIISTPVRRGEPTGGG